MSRTDGGRDAADVFADEPGSADTGDCEENTQEPGNRPSDEQNRDGGELAPSGGDVAAGSSADAGGDRFERFDERLARVEALVGG
jgi:hypothetical protein